VGQNDRQSRIRHEVAVKQFAAFDTKISLFNFQVLTPSPLPDPFASPAESQKTSLPEIQGKQAELWRNRSFKGEWIETPGPDGSWKWVQKEG